MVSKLKKLRVGRLFDPIVWLVRDRRGVSAVEFALILPVMLTLYLGGVELSDALIIQRKVTHVTSSLGDLVTQAKSISDNDMSNILDAAASVMTPYSTGSLLKIRISQIKIDGNGKATVTWSDARNDTPLTKGATITGLPAAVAQANTYIVTAEVHYSYTPTIGYLMTGSFDLNDEFYLRPRLTDCISRGTTYTCS